MNDYATTELRANGGMVHRFPQATSGPIPQLKLTSDGSNIRYRVDANTEVVLDEVWFTPAREGLIPDRHTIEVCDSAAGVTHDLVLVFPEDGKPDATQVFNGGGAARWTLTVKTKPKVVTPPLTD